MGLEFGQRALIGGRGGWFNLFKSTRWVCWLATSRLAEVSYSYYPRGIILVVGINQPQVSGDGRLLRDVSNESN